MTAYARSTIQKVILKYNASDAVQRTIPVVLLAIAIVIVWSSAKKELGKELSEKRSKSGSHSRMESQVSAN